VTKEQILKKIAYMEFVHDQLSAELEEIDSLLKQIGFPNGLESARLVALEMIQEEDQCP
jgi:hypothetical protein